jgi:hypothetical protein
MNIELEYRARIDDMSVVDRIRRAEVLFNWSRDYLVRSIMAAREQITDADVKWEVAFRQYGADPATKALIDELRNRAAR